MADQKETGALFKSMVIEGRARHCGKQGARQSHRCVPRTGRRYRHQYVHDHGVRHDPAGQAGGADAGKGCGHGRLRAAARRAAIRALSCRCCSVAWRKSCARRSRWTGVRWRSRLREGVDTAYKAVMKPAEGTSNCVGVYPPSTRSRPVRPIRRCPQSRCFAQSSNAVQALAETVHQNPVLEKGGRGGHVCVRLPRRSWRTRGRAARRPQGARGPAQPAAKAAATSPPLRTRRSRSPIGTEFDCRAQATRPATSAAWRAILSQIGDSLVVVEDDDIVKVHVHTDQPNRALEEGLKVGPPPTVKIENMREQHTAKVIEGTADAPAERVIAPPE